MWIWKEGIDFKNCKKSNMDFEDKVVLFIDSFSWFWMGIENCNPLIVSVCFLIKSYYMNILNNSPRVWPVWSENDYWNNSSLAREKIPFYEEKELWTLSLYFKKMSWIYWCSVKHEKVKNLKTFYNFFSFTHPFCWCWKYGVFK